MTLQPDLSILRSRLLDGSGGFYEGIKVVKWQPSGARSHNGSYALYYGSLTTKNFDSGAPNSGTAILPAATIPASGSSTLTFWLWMDTDVGPLYDVLSVRLGTTVLWSKSSSTLLKQWQPVTVDLSAYAGSSSKINFYFQTKDATGNTGEGVYIDDIELKLGCP